MSTTQLPSHAPPNCRAAVKVEGCSVDATVMRGIYLQQMRVAVRDREFTAVDTRTSARGLTSIVIATHNERWCTEMCLESIRACTPQPVEIIVVDNGSTDGSVEFLRQQPEIREDHASYIEHWLKVLKDDKRAIFTAASHASKAADYLHGLQPQPQA